MVRPLPIESARPALAFAAIRLGLAVGSLLLTVALGFPYQGRLAATLAVAVAWSGGVLWLARRDPDLGLNPLVALGDLALLLAVELVVPETYGAVRFTALFLIAVHSHFQGEWRGVAMAAIGAPALILAGAIRGDAPVKGNLEAFYESAFAVSAIGAALLLGRLRTEESASRLRARGLTRRTLEAEREVRRRVAEAIHDGPVQDLIGLDMVLMAARQAASDGEGAKVDELIGEARELAERNVRALRDEIVDLGPYAFEELSFDVAIGNCLPIWRRRYGLEVMVAIEPLDLPPELAAHLFWITQEAVTNAGRHASAGTVSLSLRGADGLAELRVIDDGEGFGDVDPLGAGEPGHLGLASMRERAELLGGSFEIESSERGTKLVVRAPMGRRPLSALRRSRRA